MSLMSIHYRRMTAFVYVLLFLLAFNLFFNLTFPWFGLSIIVRVYLFVFSFYLIYNYSTIEIGRLRELYREKFGRKGNLILLAEMGLVPLVIIYGITVVFTLIDYVRLPGWPWNPIISLLNGRYSNLVIYSLFLFIILKTKWGPGFKIAIFFAVSILYFILDKLLFSIFGAGFSISIIKYAKFAVLFFFLFYPFLGERQKRRSLAYAMIAASILLFSVIGGYSLIYIYSPPGAYQKCESGLILMRFGFQFPVEELKNTVLEKCDISLLRNMHHLSSALGRNINYTGNEWERLLFSGSLENANYISGILLGRPFEVNYNKLVEFAEKKSTVRETRLEGAENYIALTAQHLGGNRDDLTGKMSVSNRNFKLFAIGVLGEARDVESIPMMLNLLIDIDLNLADMAYEALRKISELDPASELGVQRNDPEVIWRFREYYLQNRRGR